MHELRFLLRSRLPHRRDVEAVTQHDAGRVAAKALVKGRFVGFKNFVDAELMDHASNIHAASS